MSEIYDATYAVLSNKISSCNIADVIREACQLDASFAIEAVKNEFFSAAYLQQESASAMQLPSAIYKPGLSIDGNQWCALYGENLQEGVAGFGDSPALAMEDFDKAWKQALQDAKGPAKS